MSREAAEQSTSDHGQVVRPGQETGVYYICFTQVPRDVDWSALKSIFKDAGIEVGFVSRGSTRTPGSVQTFGRPDFVRVMELFHQHEVLKEAVVVTTNETNSLFIPGLRSAVTRRARSFAAGGASPRGSKKHPTTASNQDVPTNPPADSTGKDFGSTAPRFVPGDLRLSDFRIRVKTPGSRKSEKVLDLLREHAPASVDHVLSIVRPQRGNQTCFYLLFDDVTVCQAAFTALEANQSPKFTPAYEGTLFSSNPTKDEPKGKGVQSPDLQAGFESSLSSLSLKEDEPKGPARPLVVDGTSILHGKFNGRDRPLIVDGTSILHGESSGRDRPLIVDGTSKPHLW